MGKKTDFGYTANRNQTSARIAMAEHGEHDFEQKNVALVAMIIGGAVLVAGLLGIYISTF